MSTNSSLKAQFERRVADAAKRPRSVTPHIVVLSMMPGRDLEKPISVARLLTEAGVSLRKAHLAVTALAKGDTAMAAVANHPEILETVLAEFGVAVSGPRQAPDIDVKAVRAKLGLTQEEFAARFALSVDTVQNWEQGRSQMDSPTRILLAVIARQPDLVDQVLVG